ncbi:MAG TPA: response regulator transcription factor [Bacteroidota bacterium]|nr:response regulator transcription factor [Bacteroidota bacterium]
MPRKQRKNTRPVIGRRPLRQIPEGELDVLKVLVKTTLASDRISGDSLPGASFGNVRVDFVRHELFKEGKRLRANAREFQLLKYFLAHEGEVVARERLLKDVWGFSETPETRSVDNYILSLRKKIEDDAAHPRHILTFRGAGYKFTR